MKLLAICVTCLVCAGSVSAQDAGLTPAADVRKMLDGLTQQIQRLEPVLGELKPEDWIKNGAPPDYTNQLVQVKDQTEYLVQNVRELSFDPSKMTATLTVFLRLQTLEVLLDSLSQGVRRYQNPAMADLMVSVMGDNAAHRAQLRNYLVELIATKETELRLMDQETQRCRAELLRQPVQAPRNPR